MAAEHIAQIIKRRPPVKKATGGTRRKQGKKDVVKRKVVVPAVEVFANQNRFILKGKEYENKKKKGKQGAGRPPIISQEVVRILEDAFCYDATVEEACLIAGISRQTYYEFLKKFPLFADRVAELREAPMLVIRKKIVATAEHDAELGLKYSERKRKGEWSTRTEVAHSGEVVNKHHIDPEQAALIKQAMGNFGRKVAKDAKAKAEEVKKA